MNKVFVTAAAGFLLVAGGNAGAVNTTTTVGVSSTVLKTCTVTAGALNFGNYTPGAGAATGSSTINVNCTKTTPFTVALNAGTAAGSTIGQRLLANGANTLQYNLYTTNAYATVFGDGTSGSVAPAGAGAGIAVPVPFVVYGQLPDNATNQGAVPGAYSSTIAVTVTY